MTAEQTEESLDKMDPELRLLVKILKLIFHRVRTDIWSQMTESNIR